MTVFVGIISELTESVETHSSKGLWNSDVYTSARYT